MTTERDALAGLVADDATARLAAIAALPDTRAAAYALRTAAFTDRDGTVRLVAAVALARCAHPRVDAWLSLALRDPSPAAREAVLRALARRKAVAAGDVVAQVIRDEPVWWVRRTAVTVLASLQGDAALVALRDALDDPFWRVRHAAVRLLAAMGERDPALRGEIVRPDGARAEGLAARRYLAAWWSGDDALEPVGALPARDDDGLWNADPAVVTARLEALTPETVDPMSLVALLPDAHAPMRRRALWLLRRAATPDALRAACRWLDEPRVPQAVDAVSRLFARMGDAARPYARHTLARGSAAAVKHAVAWMSALDDDALPDALAARARDADPAVRAVIDEARAALDGVDAPREPLDDDDPWAMADAMSERDAVEVLRAHDDPWLRREAARRLYPMRRALDAATAHALADDLATSADPALRELAARWTYPSESVVRLLGLTTDAQPSVRAVASGALSSLADLDARLAALRDDAARPDALRRAAWSWSLRRYDDPSFALLAEAWSRDDLPAWLRAHLATLSLAFDASQVASVASLAASLPTRAPMVRVTNDRPAPSPSPAVPRRAIGRTSVVTAPLCLSGVHGLRRDDYALARAAGVTHFFWEPGYRELTRYLRRDARHADAPGVIAGTYEGSPRSIRRDVLRALRALRRPCLDVFLLFWVRSPERLSDEVHRALVALREEGLVRAIGFSTHHRDLARDAIARHPWDVVMVRHSAAHDGAEREVFPMAVARETAVLTFSTMSYGRMIRRVPGAPEGPLPRAIDCYRHAVSRPGVTATIAAPRSRRELVEILPALDATPPDDAALSTLRAHGAAVHAASRRFNALVRAPSGGSLWATEALAAQMLDETAADPTAA